jgi:hypothetical protein
MSSQCFDTNISPKCVTKSHDFQCKAPNHSYQAAISQIIKHAEDESKPTPPGIPLTLLLSSQLHHWLKAIQHSDCTWRPLEHLRRTPSGTMIPAVLRRNRRAQGSTGKAHTSRRRATFARRVSAALRALKPKAKQAAVVPNKGAATKHSLQHRVNSISDDVGQTDIPGTRKLRPGVHAQASGISVGLLDDEEGAAPPPPPAIEQESNTATAETAAAAAAAGIHAMCVSAECAAELREKIDTFKENQASLAATVQALKVDVEYLKQQRMDSLAATQNAAPTPATTTTTTTASETEAPLAKPGKMSHATLLDQINARRAGLKAPPTPATTTTTASETEATTTASETEATTSTASDTEAPLAKPGKMSNATLLDQIKACREGLKAVPTPATTTPAMATSSNHSSPSESIGHYDSWRIAVMRGAVARRRSIVGSDTESTGDECDSDGDDWTEE